MSLQALHKALEAASEPGLDIHAYSLQEAAQTGLQRLKAHLAAIRDKALAVPPARRRQAGYALLAASKRAKSRELRLGLLSVALTLLATSGEKPEKLAHKAVAHWPG